MNSKQVPKKRFKEFESADEWIIKNLSSITDVRDGTHSSPKYLEVGYPFITSKNVSNGFINYDGIQYISEEDFNEINKRSKVDIHDILMGMIGTVGNLALIRQTPYFAIKNVALIKYTGDVNYEFLYQALQTSNVNRQLKDSMDGGTQKFISLKKIRNLNIPLSTISEQLKIGKFFQNIDSLISLHQHKLDKLKNLKKSYLAELFPAEGERVPKRRFPGFEVDWEIRKLKELTEYRRGSFPQPYGKSEWYGGIGSMPFVQVVDVLSNLKLAETTKQQISKLAQNQSVFVPQGTVVITLQGSIGRVAITQYDSYVDRTLLIFEKFLFPTDIYYWALSMQQKFDIESKKAPGGTIKTITKEALSEFKIFLPTLKEQKQIGEFFQKLDKSISLQQQKLDKLKDLKKAYLNELFV